MADSFVLECTSRLYVTTTLSNLRTPEKTYESLFLVDTGATDSLAPRDKLLEMGISPVGSTAYELADGTLKEFSYGLVQIEFMAEITAGRVLFGDSTAEPILGVTALESVGILVDPANRTLKRLPAVPFK